ncbi:unnamed protein product, partial [Nesidiocoris tenuis]
MSFAKSPTRDAYSGVQAYSVVAVAKQEVFPLPAWTSAASQTMRGMFDVVSGDIHLDLSHECRDQRDPGHDWRGDTSSRDVPRALHRGTSDFGSPRETYRGPPARESRSPPRGYRIDTSPPRGYRIGASPPTRGYGHDSSHEGPSRKEYRPDFPPSRDYHRQASRDSNNRWDHRQNNVREWKSRSRDDKDHRDDSTNHREGYQRENSRPEYSSYRNESELSTHSAWEPKELKTKNAQIESLPEQVS